MTKDLSELKGMATGIGSLPHIDPKEAVDLVLEHLPQIPFWPQLPKRDGNEGMVEQFSSSVFLYPIDEKKLEDFYAKVINKDIAYFKIVPDFAEGLYAFKERLTTDKKILGSIKFIKCQITGPFTCAASINDENGVAYLHNPVFMEAFVNGLAMKALWQVNFFKDFNKKIILFIDEPYLGCFGSAYTAINREDVIKKLNELVKIIRESADVLIGIHCCGNTDWSMLMDSDIDILNFDAFGYFDRLALYSSDLKKFIERGGILAWGIVPTQEFKNQSVDILKRMFFDAIEVLGKKGMDKGLILNQSIVTPSCGMGTLQVETSKKILEVLKGLSDVLR